MSIFRVIADYESEFDQQRRDLFREDLEERLEEERSILSLPQRLLALRGKKITLLLRSGERLEGKVQDVSTTWVLVETPSDEILIPLHAMAEVAFEAGVVIEQVSVSAKLSVAAILRRLSRQRVNVVIAHDGGSIRGVISAVYADHVEVAAELDQYADVRDRCRVYAVNVVFAAIQKICVTANRW